MLLGLVLMEIKGVDNFGGYPSVVLADSTGERFLIISISESQATALRVALGGYRFPRPLTHDLMLALLDSLGWKLQKVVIDGLEDNVFYAKVYLRRGRRVKVLDARPSDALNLAARSGCPVYASEEVISRFLDDLYQELRRLQEEFVKPPGTEI